MPRSTTPQVGARLRVVTGALLLLLVVTACGSDGDRSSTAEATHASAEPTCQVFNESAGAVQVAYVKEETHRFELADPESTDWYFAVRDACADNSNLDVGLNEIVRAFKPEETVGATTTTATATTPTRTGTLTATGHQGDVVKLTVKVGSPRPASAGGPAGVDLGSLCPPSLSRATLVRVDYEVSVTSSLPADVGIDLTTDLDSTKAPWFLAKYDSGWSCRFDKHNVHWSDLTRTSGSFYYFIPDAITPNDPSGTSALVQETPQITVADDYGPSIQISGDAWLACGDLLDKYLDLVISGQGKC